MRKPLIKTIFLLLIIGLNWAGISAIGWTKAYFNDTEISENNVLTAGVLDFSLDPSADFISSPLNKGDSASFLTTLIKDEGNLGFQYAVSVADLGIDIDLCNYLTLQANLNGTPIYNNLPLSGFSATARNYIDPSAWNFIVTLPSGADDSLQDKICNFKITFSGWQENLPDFSGGFTATKKISVTINSGHWTIAPPPYSPQFGDVVINEVMWMGSKDVGSPSYDGPNDQWVELKNVSGKDLHLKGWYLTYKNEITGNENKLAEIDKNRIVKNGEYFLLSHYNKSNSAINIQRNNVLENFDYGKFQIKLYTSKDKLVLIDTAGNGISELTEGDKNNYYSMERNDTPDDGTDYANWHTCLDASSTALYWDANRNEQGTPGHDNLSENDPTAEDKYIIEKSADDVAADNINADDTEDSGGDGANGSTQEYGANDDDEDEDDGVGGETHPNPSQEGNSIAQDDGVGSEDIDAGGDVKPEVGEEAVNGNSEEQSSDNENSPGV